MVEFDVNPRISVVIPVKNEAKKLNACLDGILSQSIKVLEIIVIDSGSTDGTQKIVRAYNSRVRLIEITPTEFNHGETRNLGVRECKGDFVLMTVGDAKPVEQHWIRHMYEPMADPEVIAVCGSQVVEHSPDTNPLEWFRPQTKPKVRYYSYTSATEFDALTPTQKLQAGSWDDVTALYRKEALVSTPYRKITYGEDMCWAVDVLRKGQKLAYNPIARVYHYHLENYESALKKNITVLYMRYLIFGTRPKPGSMIIPTMKSIYRLAKEDGLEISRRWNWFLNNFQCARASARAKVLFTQALRVDGIPIEELHEKYCGTPPIPLK